MHFASNLLHPKCIIWAPRNKMEQKIILPAQRKFWPLVILYMRQCSEAWVHGSVTSLVDAEASGALPLLSNGSDDTSYSTVKSRAVYYVVQEVYSILLCSWPSNTKCRRFYTSFGITILLLHLKDRFSVLYFFSTRLPAIPLFVFLVMFTNF